MQVACSRPLGPSQEHRGCTWGKTNDPKWAQCGDNQGGTALQRWWGHGDGRVNAGPVSKRQTRKAHRTQGAQHSVRKQTAQPGRPLRVLGHRQFAGKVNGAQREGNKLAVRWWVLRPRGGDWAPPLLCSLGELRQFSHFYMVENDTEQHFTT